MDVIKVTHVQKRFGSKDALADVSFSIPKGEIFGFLGPSGSGKTTLIKILTAQLNTTNGQATVLNQPAGMMHHSAQKMRFGILTDNSGLYERLTIEENLELYRQLYDLPKASIDRVLQFVNLSGERKKRFSVLSKGMRQRAILACAIIHEPELLFLDEPTSALDPVNAAHIYKGLRYLNEKGTTIFLTTHNMAEAELLCHRVAILYQGSIKAIGSPKELKRQYRDNQVRIELTNGEIHELPQGEETADRIADWMKRGFIDRIETKEPSLGDIFIKMTGSELL
ncbi:ABC transporter ATP-binding protein [Cohnella thailandensis]|uniref:ABC transporter ATP-binding protein n=1 Tax=Cohnella thailandensis TaxID=557557 RepID=A0A841SVA9_9BACL|nr:ABC transporter ATP-binding protein [Cohnella thailandensis]MBB6634128.1 ABC transporter ATP-binding protein [Cohnella thailandensis]MBP1972379.1 ABC-2 type transport system ATP-binding protein [Cohnella thailandensis]